MAGTSMTPLESEVYAQWVRLVFQDGCGADFWSPDALSQRSLESMPQWDAVLELACPAGVWNVGVVLASCICGSRWTARVYMREYEAAVGEIDRWAVHPDSGNEDPIVCSVMQLRREIARAGLGHWESACAELDKLSSDGRFPEGRWALMAAHETINFLSSRPPHEDAPRPLIQLAAYLARSHGASEKRTARCADATTFGEVIGALREAVWP